MNNIDNGLGFLKFSNSVGLSLQEATNTWFNGETALVERIFGST